MPQKTENQHPSSFADMTNEQPNLRDGTETLPVTGVIHKMCHIDRIDPLILERSE